MSALNEIEARLAAATPGPWENDGGGEIGQHYSRPEPYQQIVSTTVSCGSYCLGGSSAGVEHHDDAELIAHAPADLAALVAVVREVEGLHQPHAVICLNPSHGKDCDAMVCDTCDAPWPCPTAAAIQRLGGAS